MFFFISYDNRIYIPVTKIFIVTDLLNLWSKQYMDNFSDAEIIDSILNGNSDDYRILIRRYQDKAFSLLRRMLRNEMDARDVLQDAFVKAFLNLKSFRKEAKFSTWLYRIVYTSALNKIKTVKRMASTHALPDDAALHPDMSHVETSDVFSKELIESIVAELPETNAVILQLFYYDSLSCEEIAGITGLTLSNVKIMLYRSRNMIKEIIEKRKLKSELV